MKYMGSKNRIANKILPIILKHRKSNQWYVEPFVGGANLIDKVSGNRIGADYNIYVIEALKLIRDRLNEIPKNNTETNEEIYYQMKNSDDIGMKGYYGFQLSYAGKWFGGWRRDHANKGRDYIAEGYRNSVKQSVKLQNVKLIHSNYLDLEIPENSIIYCDPPYENTTGYKNINFNNNEFWEWCISKTNENHMVYISEYNAPYDFISIWERELLSSLTKDTGAKKGIEKLFVHKSIIEKVQMKLSSYFF
jgi:DNA adenine methylase